jgi:hypothetical protein
MLLTRGYYNFIVIVTSFIRPLLFLLGQLQPIIDLCMHQQAGGGREGGREGGGYNLVVTNPFDI